MKKLLLPFLFIFILSINLFSQTEYLIPPDSTDPEINAWLSNNYISINKGVATLNKLFVYLPATDGKPENSKLIVKAAANLGYNAIGLTYPNSWNIAEDCKGRSDSTCFEDIHLEVITGEDKTDLVTISRKNSIENRLIKLLIYLRNKYKTEGWGQFLDKNDNIIWYRLTVAGLSQGAGHAGMIAKYHEVARVLFFAGPKDYSDFFKMPAFWIGKDNQTASDRYYGFTHVLDNGIKQLAVWNALGMDEYGDPVNLDTINKPNNNTHLLIIAEEPPMTGEYENCLITDVYTPRTTEGKPAFLEAWTYMLTDNLTSINDKDIFSSNGSIFLEQNYPNPFNSTTTISFYNRNRQRIAIRIFDILGNEVSKIADNVFESGTHTVNFNASNVSQGVYYCTMTAGCSRITRIIEVQR